MSDSSSAGASDIGDEEINEMLDEADNGSVFATGEDGSALVIPSESSPIPRRKPKNSDGISITSSSHASRRSQYQGPKISYELSDDDGAPTFSWLKDKKPKPKPKPKSAKKPAVFKPKDTEVPVSTFITAIDDPEAVRTHNERPRRPGDDLFKEVVEIPREKPAPPRKPAPEQRKPAPEQRRPATEARKRDHVYRKMTPAMMMFARVAPQVPMTKQIDLSKYDDPDFDWQEWSKNVPPRLLEMITHSEISIVFRAICGVSMAEYPDKVVSRVILELKKYLNMCVEAGLIGESSYMQCIIEGVKDERKGVAAQRGMTLEKMNEKLAEAEEKYEKRKSEWENQKAILDTEKELSLEDLEMRYQEEAAKLDEEWNSEHMQSKFNKPSAKLLEMRHNARLLLNAHRFEEAALVADEIEAREAMETEEAALRMRQEYTQANDRLRQKFEADRQVLLDTFQVKRNGIVRAEEANLRPLSQRIEKYQKMKTESEHAARRNRTALARPATARKMVSTRHAPILIEEKLKLPPLGRFATGKSKSQLS